MTRRERAAIMLADNLERISRADEHLRVVADQLRRYVDKQPNNAIIDAMLTFADAELSRATALCKDLEAFSKEKGRFGVSKLGDETRGAAYILGVAIERLKEE